MKKKRSYRSNTRQLQAELTKQRILSAAKELFSERGFDKTTIAALAEVAGVSASSIYALYRSKENLLHELVKASVFGEEYKALVDKAALNKNIIEGLRTTASITRYVCETEEAEIGFIRGAQLLSPSIKKLEKEAEQIRYECQEELVSRLFQENVIRPEIKITQAHDILWSLTSRELYRMMVIVRGWSPKQYELWLADTLVGALIKEELSSELDTV